MGILALLAGLAAAAVAWAAIGPLGAATVDPDAAASVLYFQRLTAGVSLEAFVPTTPKPALTLLYGLAWAIGHDWRVLVVLTIAAHAVTVGLACLLAGRVVLAWAGGAEPAGRDVPARGAPVAGSLAAGGVVAGMLVGSSELLLEVAHANSLVWALGAWCAAGLALSGRPGRYGLAGLALLVAALLRIETWLLIVPAAVAVAWLAWRASRGEAGGAGAILGHPALRIWIALLALPIGVLHDVLLTGDPLFSFQVSARYTAIYVPELRPEAPLEFLAGALPRWTGQPLLVVLALGGLLVTLAMARRWVAGGILALTLGDIALLGVLAARGTYVSARYYEVPDLALFMAASIGSGGIVSLAVAAVAGAAKRMAAVPSAVRGNAGSTSALGALAGAAGGILLGLVLVWPPGVADGPTSSRLALVRRASEDVPQIEAVLRTRSVEPFAAQPAAGAARRDPLAMEAATAQVLVPSQLRSRIAVDLGWPLTRVADSLAAFLPDGPAAVLRDGQVVVHDRAADPGGTRYRSLYAPLEVGTKTPSGLGSGGASGGGGLTGRLSALFVDPSRGIWVVRVGPPAGQ